MQSLIINRYTLTLLSIGTLFAVAVITGHSPFDFHYEPVGFAGLGGVPLAMAGNTILEIKSLIEDQGQSFLEIKTKMERMETQLKAEAQRGDELEKRLNRPGGGGLAPRGGMPEEARKALGHFARTGEGLERKSMSSASGPDGGFLVPESIDAQIEKLINDQSPMRSVAKVKPIDTGDYKKIVNKGGVEAGWVGEAETRSDTNAPALAEIAIPPREVYAQPKITQTLLEDSAFDAAGWLIEEITEAFLLKEGEAFLTGNGVKTPRGLLTYETAATPDATRAFGKLQFIASGSGTEITPDAIVGMPLKLKSGYRQGAVWYMNSTTAAACMKLKDNQNRYLWMNSVAAGQPPTLMGYPVVTDENMPDIAADAYPLAFGNFRRGYTITDRRQTTILRDPYTAKPYVKFYGTKRVGGGVVNFHAIKLMKIGA